jgi:hypothetical protein
VIVEGQKTSIQAAFSTKSNKPNALLIVKIKKMCFRVSIENYRQNYPSRLKDTAKSPLIPESPL